MWVPDIRLHGVGLNVILDGVCVVELDAASPFDKHTRGLLQTAADSDQSADTLYHHCKDADLKQECWNIGFGEEDYCAGCLVRSKVRGVGTISERALMLALVISYGVRNPSDARLRMSLPGSLHHKFHEILEAARRLSPSVEIGDAVSFGGENVPRIERPLQRPRPAGMVLLRVDNAHPLIGEATFRAPNQGSTFRPPSRDVTDALVEEAESSPITFRHAVDQLLPMAPSADAPSGGAPRGTPKATPWQCGLGRALVRRPQGSGRDQWDWQGWNKWEADREELAMAHARSASRMVETVGPGHRLEHRYILDMP